MRIGVLGPTIVAQADGLTGRDRRALAALVLEAPRTVSTRRLAEAVWGSDPPASWSKVLQNCVSRLRRALGFEAIVSDPGGYHLAVASDDVDANVFETFIARAEDVMTEDPAAAEQHLNEAGRLWRGAPFADLENWADAIGSIHQLESRRRRLDELRVEILLIADRLDDAIASAGALSDSEPLDERRAALLATALYRAGRTVDSLAILRRMRRTLRDELGLDPSPPLVALELSVLRHDESLQAFDPLVTRRAVSPSHPRATADLPLSLSAFVGRGEELRQIEAALREARLVTLVGPGGVGKTRLANESARATQLGFRSGAWWVELAGVQDSNDVATLIGAVLGFLPRDGHTPVRSVIEAIRDRALLVVLDNCDHVLEGVAGFATDVLSACAHLTILATSRQVLGVEGEHVIQVRPLLVGTESVDLFIDRARCGDASFDAGDRRQVEEICRQVDGIPLAIELAAACVRTLPLGELSVRLAEHVDALAGIRQGGNERHHTMRAALDWSYRLLAYEEREAFERASVFAGSFDLSAAEHLLVDGQDAIDAIEVLAGLVEKSMIVADTSSCAPFRLLQPMRQYAATKISDRGVSDALALAHATYYADLVGRLGGMLDTSEELQASSRLDAARPNVRAAFATAVARGDSDLALRIVGPLGRYTDLRMWAEPWSWAGIALALPGADRHPLRAATLLHNSRGSWQLGDHVRALELADQAIEEAEPGGTTWRDAHMTRATVLRFLGKMNESEASGSIGAEASPECADGRGLGRIATNLLLRNTCGHPDVALAERLLRQSRVCGPSLRALALHTSAVLVSATEPDRAITLNRQAVELAQTSGAVLIEGFALAMLAMMESEIDPAAGASRQVQVLARFLAAGNDAHLRGFARGMVEVLVECGAHDAAAVVVGASERNAAVVAPNAVKIDKAIERARAALGSEFDAGVRRGQELTDDELVQYLRETVDSLHPPTGSLTQ